MSKKEDKMDWTDWGMIILVSFIILFSFAMSLFTVIEVRPALVELYQNDYEIAEAFNDVSNDMHILAAINENVEEGLDDEIFIQYPFLVTDEEICFFDGSLICTDVKEFGDPEGIKVLLKSSFIFYSN